MILNIVVSCRRGLISKSCTACVCVVFSVMGAAFGAGTCGSLDRAANAIHMAEVLYPELKGRELSFQFSGGRGGPLSAPADATYLVIAVDKPISHSPARASEPSDSNLPDAQDSALAAELPLHLEFDFVGTSFDKGGSRVGTELTCQPWEFLNQFGSKQIHEAWKVINAHPGWTDEQDLEAARNLGMRFGPEKKADLLRILPLKELSSIYGPLQITEAKFKVAGLKEAETSFADLHWFITAKRVGGQKPLQLMIDPFYGKIIGISE
ncbi:MAG: hypothetical protein WAM79_03155 [Candidatus Sulfotelmatobacter sp.]